MSPLPRGSFRRFVIPCALLAAGVLSPAVSRAAPPKLLDDRLELEAIAEEPRIVTPTGIACDERGRLFVVESHTHFPPKDYDGPKHDRVRLFEDADGDGKFEKVSDFAEGFVHAMGIAVENPQRAYVITRSDIHLLEDTNDDGKADKQTVIVRLETKDRYPHNAMSGITFDPLGNLVFSLGENAGAPYVMIGSDDSRQSGGGEGGSIYRCRPDGSKLVRLATGFWNTFGLGYDAFGNLFAVDNDPDSRPPCRLMHIVDGGDYGYRFRNGRKGVHPFTAWNGELPGTLPMVCGTGEAPSGVLAYEYGSFPTEYTGKLFVTSWGDYRLDVVTPKIRGASFGGTLKTLIQGGDDFRPVCLCPGPDGSLYFTDWVKKDYTLHKRGRVWRLAAKDRPKTPSKEKPSDFAKADLKQAEAALKSPRAEIRRAAAGRLGVLENDAQLTARIASLVGEQKDDRAAIELLAASVRAGKKPRVDLDAKPSDPFAALAVHWGLLPIDPKDPLDKQCGLLHILSLMQHVGPGQFDSMVGDLTEEGFDPFIGKNADPFLVSGMVAYLARTGTPEQVASLATHKHAAGRLVSILVMRARPEKPVLATVEKLLADPDARIRRAAIQWVGEADLAPLASAIETSVKQAPTPETFQAYLAAREQLSGKRMSKEELSGQMYALTLFLDPTVDPVLKRMALKSVPSAEPALKPAEIIKALKSTDLAMAREAAWILRDAPRKEAVDALLELVADDKADRELRADACEALASSAATNDERAKKALEQFAAAGQHPLKAGAVRLLRAPTAASQPAAALPPEKLAAVKAAFEKPGNVENGRRIFFQARGIGCSVCHRVEGRGGTIGPDLSRVAGLLTDQRLVDSLVTPSKEVAPQFQTWQINTTAGKTLTGVMLERTPTKVTLADAQGQIHAIAADDIEELTGSPKSLMPDGLLAPLPDDEIRDLAAFLRTLK